MLTENDIKELKACKNEIEWNAQCDRIKAENGGDYPPDWFHKVFLKAYEYPVLQGYQT